MYSSLNKEKRDERKEQTNLTKPEEERSKEAPIKTMAQVLITEPAIVKRLQSFRMQFLSVTTGRPNIQVTMAKAQASHLHKALQDFIQQAQEIDSNVVLNTWKISDKYKTIQKAEDVLTELVNILKFL